MIIGRLRKGRDTIIGIKESIGDRYLVLCEIVGGITSLSDHGRLLPCESF